ncbi:hypothetical protein PLESTB_001135800 [Pleodorina starrii]|uniref:Uncharacterized protein n=1 Tax=Pleodorina starrii TaxID=330485 RepID=A0A9W6BR38_9CHLO|nr:hypothetical protein PLESTM_000569000 [Pleodorina starrii]GLC56694.1 hypothetical protein PLESTB_001135800 [Pleodorina starrii]
MTVAAVWESRGCGRCLTSPVLERHGSRMNGEVGGGLGGGMLMMWRCERVVWVEGGHESGPLGLGDRWGRPSLMGSCLLRAWRHWQASCRLRVQARSCQEEGCGARSWVPRGAAGKVVKLVAPVLVQQQTSDVGCWRRRQREAAAEREAAA